HLLEALSEAAAELSTSAPGAHVELGIESGEPVLVLRADGPGDDDKTEPGEPFLTYGAEGEELARLTLRLPDALKIRVEAAAAGAGASINTFIVTALARALETPSGARTTSSSRRVVARRMTGFVQG
ncbi:MAG: toxin-antitoxin system HicB family antitoxin, partial [Acidimicrobiales bacterium]